MSVEPERDQDEHANAGSGAPPAFLSGARGWITGLTSLAVAATAMVAAFGNVFASKPADAPQAAVSSSPADVTAPATAEGVPTVYTGDKTRIEWNDRTWELSSPDGQFSYEEMLSTDDNMVLVFDKTRGEYLRWPIKGGMMEYSADDRQSWITYAEVTAEE